MEPVLFELVQGISDARSVVGEGKYESISEGIVNRFVGKISDVDLSFFLGMIARSRERIENLTSKDKHREDMTSLSSHPRSYRRAFEITSPFLSICIRALGVG